MAVIGLEHAKEQEFAYAFVLGQNKLYYVKKKKEKKKFSC